MLNLLHTFKRELCGQEGQDGIHHQVKCAEGFQQSYTVTVEFMCISLYVESALALLRI